MPREMSGSSPEERFSSEREATAEDLRLLLENMRQIRESVSSKDTVKFERRHIITTLCTAVESLMSDEINLQQNPEFESTNSYAEIPIRRALFELSIDTEERQPSE